MIDYLQQEIGWVNNLEAGDLRRHRAHYDDTVMVFVWRIYVYEEKHIVQSICIKIRSPTGSSLKYMHS